MDKETGLRIIALKDRIEPKFTAGDWEELGLLTGFTELFDTHPRLYRSLRFNDEDYAGNVLTVLGQMVAKDESVLKQIETFVDTKYPEEGVFISDKPAAVKM